MRTDAFRLGGGSQKVLLLGGAHADEPVGPDTLRFLVREILDHPAPISDLLSRFQFLIVPHINPDGEVANNVGCSCSQRDADSDGVTDCVNGANIRLEQDGTVVARSTTDAFGEFKLDGLPPDSGAYRLSIEVDGVEAKQLDVELGKSTYIGRVDLAA